MNIISIWEDFYKESRFDNLGEVLDFIKDKYNMDADEAKELMHVSDLAIEEYFDHDKLFRKTGIFKKEIDRSAHDTITALFINGVFFGMFLSDFLKWKFPKK
jgi:hypothetical protein